MPTQVQFRRGTTAQNNNFTGAQGEITVNTSNNTLRVHDGTTAGGYELATVTHVTNSIANVIDSAPALLDTLNELAAAINDDPNFYTTITGSAGVARDQANAAYDRANVAVTYSGSAFDKANTLVATVAGVSSTNISNTVLLEGIKAVDGSGSGLDADLLDGQSSSYYTNADNISSGTLNASRLATSGVSATTYGGASKVPVIAVDQYGRITSAANVNVAGVTNFAASGNTFTISTADGGSFSASIQTNSVRLGTDTTGDYVQNVLPGAGIAVSGAVGESRDATVALTSTGVAASTYGGAAVQPVFTVDAYGRITSASNVTSTVANTNIVGNVISSQITSVNASQITGDIALGTQTSGNYVASITGTSGRVSVSGSASEGATPTVDLSTSGVTANTYGGSAVQPVFAVDAYGRITSASNVTSTVANTNITGNIIASQIAPTGVTAATYGNATLIPSIVVDQQGRITGASNVAVSVPAGSITGDIVLGTQTSGAYVGNLVAGTGVTLTGLGNEGATPTIAIGQAVSTTSDVTFANVTVTGNLLVQGNTVEFSANTLVINDPLIQVGKSPAGDAVDLGFFGHYIGGSPSIERHAGLFRDATDGQFKLFTNLDPEPATIVDTANATYQSANLVVNFVVGKVSDISNHTTASLAENSANLYYTNARAYANIVAAGFYDTVSNTAPIGASESGTTLTLTHLNSGVAAATYGGAATVPVYTVNATGHITSASNATISIPSSALNTDVALGSQTSGNYIATIAGTSGRVTVSGSGAESAAATIDLATSGVSASTYGGAAVQPVLTVDTYGRITSASNVTSTVANTNITGNIIGSQIAATGVTASTYGGADRVSVFTVDQQGRLTSASNVVISIPSSAINTDVALGSQTSGNYVATVTAGTGISTSGAATGEGIAHSISLATSGVSAATYGGGGSQIPTLVVDTYGRVTSAANVATTSITTLGTITTGTWQGSSISTTYTDAKLTSVSATSPIATSGSTGAITLSHAASGVAATTYGSAAIVPVYTVNSSGHITSASNVTISIPSSALNTDVALGTQTSGNYVATLAAGTGISSTGASSGEGIGHTVSLATSGVSASTYGGASTAAVITVDAYGRITSASNATIASGFTTAQANSRIAASRLIWGL